MKYFTWLTSLIIMQNFRSRTFHPHSFLFFYKFHGKNLKRSVELSFMCLYFGAHTNKTLSSSCSSGKVASGRACWRFGKESQMTQSLWSSGKKCRIGIWSSVLELVVRIGRAAEQQMANDMRRGFGELGAKRAWNPGSFWH